MPVGGQKGKIKIVITFLKYMLFVSVGLLSFTLKIIFMLSASIMEFFLRIKLIIKINNIIIRIRPDLCL